MKNTVFILLLSMMCYLYCYTKGNTMNIKHGKSRTKEYAIWTNLKYRCYKIGSNDYNRYGARGIRVCDRWLNSFDNFITDMGPRPSLKHSVDRIDNNGNYEPNNCRWATQKEQSNNRRSNTFVKYNGITKTIAKWADYFGMDQNTMCARLQHGWSIEEALTTPVQSRS